MPGIYRTIRSIHRKYLSQSGNQKYCRIDRERFKKCGPYKPQIIRFITCTFTICVPSLFQHYRVLKSSSHPLNYAPSSDQPPDQSVINFLSYPKLNDMKTIFTIVSLIAILSVSATSALLYLSQHYNVSALLTITWIVSLAAWIKSNGLLDDKKASYTN